jgi:predicted DNA-binding transcriptional regulator AlpA
MSDTPTPPGSMRKKAAADYLGISVGTLRRLSLQPGGPKPRALAPRCVVYLRAELDAVLASAPVSNVPPVGKGSGKEAST